MKKHLECCTFPKKNGCQLIHLDIHGYWIKYYDADKKVGEGHGFDSRVFDTKCEIGIKLNNYNKDYYVKRK